MFPPRSKRQSQKGELCTDALMRTPSARGPIRGAIRQDRLRPAAGGQLVLVAVPHDGAPLAVPFAQVYRRKLSLIAARNYVADDFREAMRLIAEGAVAVEPMVTGSFPLAEFETAYAELTGHPERHLKVLLRP